MAGQGGRITKADLLRKIEIMLRHDINLDAHQVFAKVEEFLIANEATQPVSGEGIGYVQINEERQDEYLAWENSIKQEWFAIIEEIREGIKRENR